MATTSASLLAGSSGSGVVGAGSLFSHQSDELAKSIEKLVEQMTSVNLERLKKIV